MESTNWRSLGKKIGKGLVNAVTVQVKYYFTSPERRASSTCNTI